MRKFYAAFLLTAMLLVTSVVCAQSVYIAQTPFINSLTAPIEVVNAADGSNRLFVVQQNGIIRVFDPLNGGLQATPFLNVQSIITYGGERGLLSLAFHPAYEINGYFYIYYNNTNGDITIARYRATGTSNVADAASGVVLLNIPKPFDNHNGGHLQFAKDSTLFFATGDGGSGNDPQNNAQNPLSRLGKMLRLKVYTNPSAPYFEAPDNNPFVGNASYDSLIWAMGLRNPFRWSFDQLTGDMWIGDVGQGAKEEVNFVPASSTGGENYGWRCYEGSIPNPNIAACNVSNYVPPIFDYDNPGSGSSSVVGGYVYRGTQYPSLYGYYITTDVYTDSLYLIKPNGSGGWTILRQKSLTSFVVSFGEGEDGRIYAVSQGSGTVYLVEPTAPLPAVLSSFVAKPLNGANELQWTTASEKGSIKFLIEFGFDGTRFTKAGEIVSNGNVNGGAYSFIHSISSNVALFYRLAMIEANGAVKYSSIVMIGGKEPANKIYPSVVTNGILYVQGNNNAQKLQVVNNNGGLVYERALSPLSSQTSIQLPPLTKGIYIVRLTGGQPYSQKILIQ